MDRRFTIGLAAGRRVTSGLGTPDLRGVLSLAFVPHAAAIAPIHPYIPPAPDLDADGDGIIDRLDRCPREPEDKDGFQDAELVVSATGYRAWRKTIDITEESKVVTVVIDLEPVH